MATALITDSRAGLPLLPCEDAAREQRPGAGALPADNLPAP